MVLHASQNKTGGQNGPDDHFFWLPLKIGSCTGGHKNTCIPIHVMKQWQPLTTALWFVCGGPNKGYCILVLIFV